MYKSLLLALMLLFTGCSIEGTITNKDGKPISNANIIASYNGETQEAKSDTDGHYLIEDLDEGSEVTLSVSKTNFIAQSKSVTVDKETAPVNFTLEDGKIEIESIIGEVVDGDGNALKAIVSIFEDSVNRDFSEGFFTITNEDNLEKWVDISKPLKLSISYTIGNTGTTTTRIFDPSNYLEQNLPSDISDTHNYPYHLNLGTIVIEDSIVKACATNIDGTPFGKGIFDDGSEYVGGVANTILSDTYQKVYDDDNGEFEISVQKDGRKHHVLVVDKDGNTNMMEFIADTKEIDLRESCIQVMPLVEKENNITLITDPKYSIESLEISKDLNTMQREEHTILSDTRRSFTSSENSAYILLFKSSAEAFKENRHLNFTLDFNGVEYNVLTGDILRGIKPDTYLYVFGIYQGEIVLIDNSQY